MPCSIVGVGFLQFIHTGRLNAAIRVVGKFSCSSVCILPSGQTLAVIIAIGGLLPCRIDTPGEVASCVIESLLSGPVRIGNLCDLTKAVCFIDELTSIRTGPCRDMTSRVVTVLLLCSIRLHDADEMPCHIIPILRYRPGGIRLTVTSAIGIKGITGRIPKRIRFCCLTAKKIIGILKFSTPGIREACQVSDCIIGILNRTTQRICFSGDTSIRYFIGCCTKSLPVDGLQDPGIIVGIIRYCSVLVGMKKQASGIIGITGSGFSIRDFYRIPILIPNSHGLPFRIGTAEQSSGLVIGIRSDIPVSIRRGYHISCRVIGVGFRESGCCRSRDDLLSGIHCNTRADRIISRLLSCSCVGRTTLPIRYIGEGGFNACHVLLAYNPSVLIIGICKDNIALIILFLYDPMRLIINISG